MTINITGEKALELLDLAVKERGEDYVYARSGNDDAICLYWHPEEDQPGCIVGLALTLAGVDSSVLIQCEGAIGGSILAFRKNGVKISNHASNVFGAAQVWQDQGETWGYARNQAKQMHEMIKDDEEHYDISSDGYYDE